MTEVLVNIAPVTLAAPVASGDLTITRPSAATGWPGDSNGPPSANFRCTLANAALTQFEIVLVTGGQGTTTLTVQRAVEPCNNGVQTAFDFPADSTMSPSGTAAGHYPGASAAEPIRLAPVAWVLVNLTVAGFTIDPYTYANGAAGVGATVTQNTPADGALTINGGTPTVGDRVALCDLNGGAYAYCGVYTVTALGDGATVPWVLTRATDNDTAATLGTYWAVSVEGDPEFGGGLVAAAYFNPPGTFTVGTTSVDLNVASQGSLAQGIAFAYSPAPFASVAIGPLAIASGVKAVAIGGSAIAVGTEAIALGYIAKASGVAAVALGNQTTASGDNSVATGYTSTASGNSALATGYTTTASGDRSAASGWQTFATGEGASSYGAASWAWGPWYWALASGAFATKGDSAYSFWIPYNQTTDATPTALGVGSGGELGAPDVLALTFPDFKHTIAIQALVVARRTDVPGTASWWECSNLLVDGDGSGAYRIVGTPTITVIQQDSAASGWAVGFSLVDTDTAFAVTVTGEIGSTIQWTCTLKLYEVAG